MNIAYSDLQVAAKTSGCKDGNARKVAYRFLGDCHLCVDKRDIFEGEMKACESLLQCTMDVSERAVLEQEVTELRAILERLGREDVVRAFVPTKVPAKKTAARKANFVICQDCFWCASCFRQDGLPACPACSSRNIDPLPIFEGEHYRLEFSQKHSVNLMFKKA